MSIEGILLEHFSAFTKGRYKFNYTMTSTSCSVSQFLFDYSKQDSDTTTTPSKHFIALLKYKKLFTILLSTIWENPDSCDEQYRCASVLYLLSVMSQCYSVIIYQGISSPEHGKEVVDVLNAVDKRYI